MTATEAEPVLHFKLQNESLDSFMAQQVQSGSRVYVPLGEEQAYEYLEKGCPANQLLNVIQANIPAEFNEERELATDSLRFILSFPTDRLPAIPVYGPEEQKFYFVLPGGSTGEEMTQVSIAKVSAERKSRSRGQA